MMIRMHQMPILRREVLAGEVRAEMARQKITRAALADATGLKKDKLRRLLDGAQSFPAEDLDAVSAFLGMDLANLIEISRAA